MAMYRQSGEMLRHASSIGKTLGWVAAIAVQTALSGSPAASAGTCALPSLSQHFIEFDPQCVYKAPIVIDRSDTTLDCRGATIDGGGKERVGIRIGGKERVTDVTVRNCIVKGITDTGAVVRWDKKAKEVNKLTRAEAYALAPQRIRLQSITFVAPPVTGVYLGEYSTRVEMVNLTFAGFKTLAIYLEYSSQFNVIDSNRFLAPTDGKSIREAIAVDSSALNTISRNIFRGAMPAAIELYRNCQERIHKFPDAPFRWQSSQRNMIVENSIDGAEVGVWIAARQSKDLAHLDCGNPSYGNGKYFRDWAPENFIAWNTFTNVATPLVIEDDRTTVVGNRITTAEVCGRVGTGPRSKLLNMPVKGTLLANNSCDSQEGFRFDNGATPATGQ